MTNIGIKKELRKEFTHLSGLKCDILLFLQQSTSGVQKIPPPISRGNSGRVKKEVDNLKKATLKNKPKTLIFSKIEYLKGGKVDFCLSQKAMDLWHKGNGAFYQIDLEIYTSLKSKFAKGLYELLCCFKCANIGMNLSSVRAWLNATNKKYLKPSHFINKAFKPAKDELEALTKIKIKHWNLDGYWLKILANFPPSEKNKHIKNNSLFLSMGRMGIPARLRRKAITDLGEEITKQVVDDVQYEMAEVSEKDRRRVMKSRIIHRLMDALGIERTSPKRAQKKSLKKEAKTTAENSKKIKKLPKNPTIIVDKNPYGQSFNDYFNQIIQRSSC